MRLAPLLLAAGCQALPPSAPAPAASSRPLTGRFLHITDFHPDPFYKTYAATTRDAACHRAHGPAGLYGAETSACDSPLSLVNATFDWIRAHVADDIDFVVWTGDSARHDNDDRIPRSDKQVVEQNELIVDRFRHVFGRAPDDDDDPTNDFVVPIIPTFGNNDILPHNIFREGPNRWTAEYLNIWRSFVPEEQRHQFQRGGWFFVEAIPNKLAVFSLNTMYFFDSNNAVDGCAMKSEPGYEHMEWLRIQLQILRERGMKAILIGHVPPARTENKQSWDETCWQKYALWMRQYRDVVITALYGHMNIDHFMLQDFTDIRKSVAKGKMKGSMDPRLSINEDGEVSTMGASDYLIDLRDEWAELPRPSKGKKENAVAAEDDDEDEEGFSIVDRVNDFFGWKKNGKDKGDDDSKFLEEIGGPWGERYSFSLVGPSVVPNYFPTMRVYEYNITGLETLGSQTYQRLPREHTPQKPLLEPEDFEDSDVDDDDSVTASKKKKSDDKAAKKHKKKKYKFTVPKPPSKSAPPGPAYSPQTLSLLGYTQYFANLTRINNDFHDSAFAASNAGTNPTKSLYTDDGGDDADYGDGFGAQRWREGKHHGKKPKHPKPSPLPFEFEIEYQTFNDSDLYKLQDLTVRSYIDLARRIGSFKHKKGKSKMKREVAPAESESESELWDGVSLTEELAGDDRDVAEREDDELRKQHDFDDANEYAEADESADEAEHDGVDAEKKKKKKKKKKKGHHKGPKDHVWYTFVKRAFVQTMGHEDVQEQFGWISAVDDEAAAAAAPRAEMGDGEL